MLTGKARTAVLPGNPGMGKVVGLGPMRVPEGLSHVLYLHLSGGYQDFHVAQAQGRPAPCSRAEGAPWIQAGTLPRATLAAPICPAGPGKHGGGAPHLKSAEQQWLSLLQTCTPLPRKVTCQPIPRIRMKTSLGTITLPTTPSSSSGACMLLHSRPGQSSPSFWREKLAGRGDGTGGGDGGTARWERGHLLRGWARSRRRQEGAQGSRGQPPLPPWLARRLEGKGKGGDTESGEGTDLLLSSGHRSTWSLQASVSVTCFPWNWQAPSHGLWCTCLQQHDSAVVGLNTGERDRSSNIIDLPEGTQLI